MSKYSTQLKDPRWQKRRLEILEAADWKCEECRDPKKQLQVHHSCYTTGKDVWDYPDDLLIALCDEHHVERQGVEDAIKRIMMARLRRTPTEKLKSVFFELFDEACRRGLKL